jgi:hypothetical protein
MRFSSGVGGVVLSVGDVRNQEKRDRQSGADGCQHLDSSGFVRSLSNIDAMFGQVVVGFFGKFGAAFLSGSERQSLRVRPGTLSRIAQLS